MKTATRRECRHCERPIIVIPDEAGETRYLDAGAEVYDVVRDPDDGVEFATLAAESFVSHAAACPAMQDAIRRKAGRG